MSALRVRRSGSVGGNGVFRTTLLVHLLRLLHRGTLGLLGELVLLLALFRLFALALLETEVWLGYGVALVGMPER